MAKTKVLSQTTILAAQSPPQDVHTVAASKLDTVKVFATNKAGATITYRIFVSNSGGAHSDDDAIVWDETISSPGSGISPAIVLAATDKLRVYADVAGLRITVNGYSEDA